MAHNQGSVLSKLILFLLVVAMLGGGGYYGYTKYFHMQEYGADFRTDLETLTVKEDVLRFTYKRLPETYLGLVDFNDEILVINKEIERLELMEKEFPEQIKIIEAEKKIWVQLKKEITSALAGIEKEIENIYVTDKVNKENGVKIIMAKKTELKAAVEGLLKISLAQTARLKEKPKPAEGGLKGLLLGIIEKLRK